MHERITLYIRVNVDFRMGYFRCVTASIHKKLHLNLHEVVYSNVNYLKYQTQGLL